MSHREYVISELKHISVNAESVNLHRFFALVAAALVLLLERK